ncbi:MAG: YkgJ family cysteine cluster protein [Methanocalculaceae archaeon]|jgi:Fe-S-cluster containining protein|nr:YkgJ family cysteine cluster protein [Methanocalculaceae archaeon]
MAACPDVALAEYRAELDFLRDYPAEKLAEVIMHVGFSCTCCGRCCTRVFNGHVYLLTEDTRRLREFAPEMLMPAPGFPYSDPDGSFYVSGYCLRTKPNGDCVFLNEARCCTIYDQRFAICRIYPYMLHREPDLQGRVNWRQIGGLDEHGEYNTIIPAAEAEAVAADVIAYETAYLEQEILFHEALLEMFSAAGIRFVRRDHDRRLRNFLKNSSETVVYVGDDGALRPERVQASDYR